MGEDITTNSSVEAITRNNISGEGEERREFVTGSWRGGGAWPDETDEGAGEKKTDT